jgi:hypothetical protein
LTASRGRLACEVIFPGAVHATHIRSRGVETLAKIRECCIWLVFCTGDFEEDSAGGALFKGFGPTMMNRSMIPIYGVCEGNLNTAEQVQSEQ